MWLGASLLDRGVDVNAQADGFIAVNMAATMGQPEAVRFLIARGVAREVKNRYRGTSLGGALWGALNTSDNCNYVAVIGALLAAGARIEPGMVEWWENNEQHLVDIAFVDKPDRGVFRRRASTDRRPGSVWASTFRSALACLQNSYAGREIDPP